MPRKWNQPAKFPPVKRVDVACFTAFWQKLLTVGCNVSNVNIVDTSMPVIGEVCWCA